MPRGMPTNFIKRLFKRHQHRVSVTRSVRAGFKGFIALTMMAAMGYFSELPLVVASFGASCILVFTTPEDEFSQPVNIVGGYFVSGLLGIILSSVLPHEWWTLGLLVGACTVAMAMFRVTHPPAGSLPIIIYLHDQAFDFSFLLFPVLVGSIVLVSVAMILHRVPPKQEYPIE